MTMGMSGVNNWVTDVCGVEMGMQLQTDQMALCTRWMELAAFLPMVRIQGPLTDYAHSDASFALAMSSRLPYTRYIYSQMFFANYTGGAVTYPLFFDFPTDDETFNNVEKTYMLGDAIKVSPVVEDDTNSTFRSYFPQGVWMDLNNFTNRINASEGGYHDLTKLDGQANLHLAPGKIIPFQAADSTKHQTTKDFTQ
jgi:alpha-glucosidase (family GH31 glycosyl hydrolase)